MGEMVDRIATVLAACSGDNHTGHAKAVISAMRDPTVRMENAFSEVLADNYFGNGIYDLSDTILRKGYRAMIDAALKDG